jgi:DNA-binding MarR family transcriptional regulator
MARQHRARNRDGRLPAATSAERAFVNLIQLGDRLHKQDDAFFRPYGLSSAQYNVLRIVEGAGEPLPQREIASRLLVTRANVTGLVDKLEATGYLERTADQDRRVRLVRLTPKGRAFLRATFTEQAAMCGAALAALSATEGEELRRLTKKLLQDHPLTTRRRSR